MPHLQQPLVIVTDLDGSLLDHHSYRWDAATEWLARLQQQAIPLVICSSKTAAEIIPLQKKLGLVNAPFIAENGALLQRDATHRLRIPDAQKTYPVICESLAALQTEFRFKGFYDFTDHEVAAMTGLSDADAALARQRDASEVLIWRDSNQAFEVFREAIREEGLALTQGGRFWHVLPAGAGKEVALKALLASMASEQGIEPITIGLGDGPNDAPMLDSVDYAVVIKGYSKTPVTLQRQDQKHVYHTAHHGPEGWREGLDYFLSEPE